ncbi:MAG TPA: hypothetical protein VKI18_09070 [Albitalea sp.]|nr:hypothetical protein [Albitalea sp.]
MRDFEDSTLWRISAFERVRYQTGTSGFARLGPATLLPTTLMADLQRVENNLLEGDVLEIVAACMRHHEPALLYLQHEELVWPITLFPSQLLYHSPRDMALASTKGMAGLKVLGYEPPGVRPPGHWMFERVAAAEHYRPMPPLLWAIALHGPRNTLLDEIGGTAAYRALKNPADEGLVAPGALGSAAERLRRESAPLRDIARWPGMSTDRASRLLNALYLATGLLVTRSHPAARAQPGMVQRFLGRGKPRK